MARVLGSILLHLLAEPEARPEVFLRLMVWFEATIAIVAYVVVRRAKE